MTRVLVTGATGFVGLAVCSSLSSQGVEVIAASRSSRPEGAQGGVRIGPDSSFERLREATAQADAVIHLAAAVHDMKGRTTADEYQRANRDYPLLLARAALASNVRRFIFVSTIKVNGDGTSGQSAYSEASAVTPDGPYAINKWQAEQGLREFSAASGLEACSVRPPLVYGPGVRANFLSLMSGVRRGVPLPFGALNNARSLIYVGNLADLLVRLALGLGGGQRSPTYLASDGEDLSTPELVRRIASALGVRPRLFNVPEALLRAALAALGRRPLADRLLGSLRVDSSLVQREQAWVPPFSVSEGLARTAEWLERQT